MLPETVTVELTCGTFELEEPSLSEILRLNKLTDDDLDANVEGVYRVARNTPAFADAFPDLQTFTDAIRPSDMRRMGAAVQKLLGGEEGAGKPAETTFRGDGG